MALNLRRQETGLNAPGLNAGPSESALEIIPNFLPVSSSIKP